MRKKLLSVLMSTCMAAGLLAGSGAAAMTAEAAEGEKTKITVYLGGDAADENQKIIETFNEQSDTIEAEMVTLTEGSSG